MSEVRYYCAKHAARSVTIAIPTSRRIVVEIVHRRWITRNCDWTRSRCSDAADRMVRVEPDEQPYTISESGSGMWWAQCHRCPHHCLTSTRAGAEAAAETHQKTHEKESSR